MAVNERLRTSFAAVRDAGTELRYLERSPEAWV